MAEDLMTNEELEYCLVVGAEEVDWLLCDAYRRWRLLRLAPPVEPFNKTARGMILSEGAGAVLLSRKGPIMIAQTDAGAYYRKRTETEEILSRILSGLTQAEVAFVISSANGTFIDQAECRALRRITPDAIVYTAKPAVGESVGAAGLWQVILGAQALDRGELPPLLHVAPTIPLRIPASRTALTKARHAIVLSCGVNHQAAGLRLSMP
jgi:3-oxoacyl-(acyl-carrier-protein) synthase